VLICQERLTNSDRYYTAHMTCARTSVEKAVYATQLVGRSVQPGLSDRGYTKVLFEEMSEERVSTPLFRVRI
jgi:hypothetical protein